jgi:atypical dual specificity phosphatase
VQNRAHVIDSKYDKMYETIDKWVAKHTDELAALLEPGGVETLYAEWMYVTHTVPYTHLPDVCIVHGLYDARVNAYVSYDVMCQRLATCTTLIPVPLIAKGRFKSLDQLVVFVYPTPVKSLYYNGPLEGVCIWACDSTTGTTLQRCKLVCKGFTAGVHLPANRRGVYKLNGIVAASS